MWSQTINDIMKRAMEVGEIYDIGLLNYMDEGYPISLPNYFQIHDNKFYFSSLANSRHTNHFLDSPPISFTIYYPLLNQTTILFKGKTVLVKKNSVHLKYKDNQDVFQHLFELRISSIEVSELLPDTRHGHGIIREIQRIYPYTRQKRRIILKTDLDDLQKNMKERQYCPKIL